MEFKSKRILDSDSKSAFEKNHVFEHKPLSISEAGASREARKPELLELNDSLKTALPKLSKREMGNLTSEIRKYYVKKFHRRKTPKYGSLNKGFTSQELQAFFRAIDDDKFHLIFSYQAQLGLRIGEVCRLHLSGINFQTRELTLKTEKAKVIDSLIIPVPLFTDTVNFIRLHESQIEQAGGYLFFNDSRSLRQPSKPPSVAPGRLGC